MRELGHVVYWSAREEAWSNLNPLLKASEVLTRALLRDGARINDIEWSFVPMRHLEERGLVPMLPGDDSKPEAYALSATVRLQESFVQVKRLSFTWARCDGCGKGDQGHVGLFGLAKASFVLCDLCLGALHRKLDEVQPEEREAVSWP